MPLNGKAFGLIFKFSVAELKLLRLLCFTLIAVTFRCLQLTLKFNSKPKQFHFFNDLMDRCFIKSALYLFAGPFFFSILPS